jgi:hypothetical protein
MLATAEQDQAEHGVRRVSDNSDTGLKAGPQRTHRQHPSEIMITLIMWTL